MKDFQTVKDALDDNGRIEQLCEAFTLFSGESGRTEPSYVKLKEQLKQLYKDLNASNQLLQNKVAELDLITIYLKSILENISQGILFIDLNGIVTTCNQAAENILGVSIRKILFHDFWQNFKDDVFHFSMKEILRQKQDVPISCVSYTKPNRQHRDLEVVARFVLHDDSCDSQPLAFSVFTPKEGIIVMLRDVTEIHHLQTLANRNDRMKLLGEMASQVAHEIRNPLGGIKGFASLLKRDLTHQPQLQQMAGYIVEGTDNLNRLVGQILHYSRPLQPHFEKVNIIALLNELKQHILADDTINKQQIAIQIASDLKEIVFSLDPSLFKAALLNLIVNAAQAMPNGGTITIKIQAKSNEVIFTIIDTGVGIAEDVLPKIFSPFFTTKLDGNGLGLAETQKIIQAHGGSIEASSALGQGTTFIIKIPFRSL